MKGAINYFIKRPTLVNLMMFLLVGLGILKLSQTQNTNFPKQKTRFVDVSVAFPGASPSEVEEGITIKIEDNLEGIEGIDRVTSTSQDNLATINVELTEEAKADKMLVEVKNAVDKITNFPAGVESASVEKRDPQDLTVSFGIMAKDMPLTAIKDIAKQIEDDFLAQPGLSQVVIQGVPDEEIEVRLRENDLRRYNLTFQQVSAAVRQANLETFGGTIENEAQVINIKTDNKGYFANDLKNIIISAGDNGQTVYLKDVADVADQFKDSATGRYFKGEPIITMSVYTLNSEDILANAEFVKNYIDTYNETRKGIELLILEDGTVNLKSRIGTMIENGITGVILVLLVLALFLDRYLAFWLAVKIPIVLLGMFLLTDIQDMTINVVSLFGFILVLGILVDDAVVVGENIYHHAKELGKPPLKAALDGTMEMLSPVIISLSTTATAFAMFFFLPEQVGEFFQEVAFVVIAVLIMAIIETFFILPGHVGHAKGIKEDIKLTKIEKWFTNAMEWMRSKLYMPAFSKTVLKNKFSRLITVVVFIGLLIGSVALIPAGVMGFTFFPNIDDDAVFVEMELPPGTPVEVTKQKLMSIEEAVWEVNEDYSEGREDGKDIIRFVEVITGPLDNQGELKITFLNGEERGISSFDISNSIAEEAPAIPEATRLIYGLGATSALFGLPVSFALKSYNLDEVRAAKEDLKIAMRDVEGLRDVSDTDLKGITEYQVRLKPNAELLGLSLSEVMAQIRSAFFGVEAQSLQRGDEEVEIWLRYPEEGRQNKAQLLDMRINGKNGSSYALSEVAYIEETVGNLTIDHLNGQREIRVEANVANKDVSAPQVIGQIESEVLTPILEKYPSVTYSVEGQSRQAFKLIDAMKVVGPIILLLIFSLIVFNCNSFAQAIMIFLLFPFALTGVIIGHLIHGEALNIFSLIGTIALIGVFVNNTLVYISTLNDLLKEGREFMEAVKEAAYSRFRPIVLTTITTVAGLGPLIFSTSLSAQFLKGPAIAIAYGLLFGLFNVLFLMPIFLINLNKFRVFWAKKVQGKKDVQRRELEPAVRLAMANKEE
ncbi:efflux RND transporter permease subunit [Aquimarina celericrescens]|uniref:Efflux RND transporter permease subunit n=1 Tax=Aquimarina celericrescens TaxID=1964542 RepID=A0ABW5AUM2_9FLAO|nr:efflux RND transporter permease subunit [Aquimarina celericrescens]